MPARHDRNSRAVAGRRSLPQQTTGSGPVNGRLVHIDMPIRTVGEYLKHWGFSAQKPMKRAYEQNPNAVQCWLDGEYPAIKSRAKKESAEIYWGDETGLRNDSQHERGYAPKEKTGGEAECRAGVGRHDFSGHQPGEGALSGY